MESDRVMQFSNSIFQNFLQTIYVHLFSRCSNKVPPIAEKFIKSIRNNLKKPLFEEGNVDWLRELPITVNKFEYGNQYPTKMTTTEAS